MVWARAINLPYVIECFSRYGGCGFITEPSMNPPRLCPRCGNIMELTVLRKYMEEIGWPYMCGGGLNFNPIKVKCAFSVFTSLLLPFEGEVEIHLIIKCRPSRAYQLFSS